MSLTTNFNHGCLVFIAISVSRDRLRLTSVGIRVRTVAGLSGFLVVQSVGRGLLWGTLVPVRATEYAKMTEVVIRYPHTALIRNAATPQ